MLRLTELVADNDDGLTDAEGDTPDWFEVFNSGTESVDMSGMHVTDNDDNLTKWTIPNGTTLDGGAYLVIFASNKDGVLAGGELHTNFALSAGGEYLALVDMDGSTILDEYAPEFPAQFEDVSYGLAMEPTGTPTTLIASGAALKAWVPTNGGLGTNWTQVTYTDGLWPISGTTGIGYENNPGDSVNYTDEINTTVTSGTTSVYVRVKFNLASLEDISYLTLGMKYDDGFVAYINGVKVAEANAPENPAWNSVAVGSHSDSEAEQFQDFDASAAVGQLQIGENVLAIHGLNLNSSSDMLILPELLAQPAAITVPNEFGFFPIPTPGYGNGDSVAGFVAQPTFSVPHGFYDTSQSVAISTTTSSSIIVYTTDGSTPEVDESLSVTNGTLYGGPLNISSTTPLRARAFRADYEPSYVSSSTYLFLDDVLSQSPTGTPPSGWPADGAVNGQEMNYGIDPDIISLYGSEAVKDSLLSISTFSITTDLENLFDPTSGIYVNALNRGISWERPATVELINPDGSAGFEANAGLRIRGGYSRNDFNPKHAFRFYFRSVYGVGKLDYELFDDEGVDEFDVLDLRTAQNYSWSSEGNNQDTFVREVFARDTQRDMGDEYTRSRYYHLYINGVYWGLFQTQERVEEHFSASYFGGDPEDYDVVKADLANTGATEINEGNDLAWQQLFNYAEDLYNDPVTNAENYWTMQGLNPDGTRNESLPVLLDTDNLIDFMLVIFYTGGYDTGLSRFASDNYANNWFGLYNRETADEGFQFFIHDNEHSLGADYPDHASESIDRTGPFHTSNEDNYLQFNPQYLHQDLLAHPEYVQKFIDRVQLHFFNGGALTVAENVARFQARADEVQDAIIAEAARWGDAQVNPPRNLSTWQNEIDWLINTYFPSRGNTVLGQLEADGLATSFSAPSFNQHGGEVSIGFNLTMTASPGTIYFTTDGQTDPREIGGAADPSASQYVGPLTINSDTTVMARLRTAGGDWSGLVQATFTTTGATLVGDYSGNGSVGDEDYTLWRSTFGDTGVGLAADGNGNNVVDAADYAVWRDNYGATLGAGSGAGADADAGGGAASESVVAIVAADVPQQLDEESSTSANVGSRVPLSAAALSFAGDPPRMQAANPHRAIASVGTIQATDRAVELLLADRGGTSMPDANDTSGSDPFDSFTSAGSEEPATDDLDAALENFALAPLV